jgi:hypothetical protein
VAGRRDADTRVFNMNMNKLLERFTERGAMNVVVDKPRGQEKNFLNGAA